MVNLNEKYVEFEMLNQRLSELQNQISSVEEQIDDLSTSINSLEELKNIKDGDEILLPIASGVFANAKITNTKELKVHVGNKIVAVKTVDSAIKLLTKRRIEHIKVHTRLNELFEESVSKAQELQDEIQSS